MNLEQMIKALAELVKGLAALEAAAMADDATEEQTKALTDALDEHDALDAKIKTAQRVADAQKKQASPGDLPVGDGGVKKHAVAEKEYDKLTSMNKIGLMTAGLARSVQRGNRPNWEDTANELVKMGYEALVGEVQNRSLISTTDTAGGFAVDETFNETIFNELRPYSAFMRGGPDIFPMPTGNYRQSGVDTRGQVGYRAEGARIAVDQPTFREINMSAKLLSGIVPMTNQLVQYTGGRAGQKAQETLSVEMGLAMDLSAFEGTGVGNNPLGLFNVPGITTFPSANGVSPSPAAIEAELRPLINIIESFATLQMGVAWVMPQRVIGYMQDLRDGNANLIYPDMQGSSPSFKGYPVLRSGTITANGGAGTDETTISLISFSNILMGDTKGLSIMISNEATYTNGGGTQVSAFENDMTLVRATMEHDWTPKYNEAIGTLTACRWGG